MSSHLDRRNISTSADILWRVFHVLTEPVLLKHGKLGTKYPSIYGYFYAVDSQPLTAVFNTFTTASIDRAPRQRITMIQICNY